MTELERVLCEMVIECELVEAAFADLTDKGPIPMEQEAHANARERAWAMRQLLEVVGVAEQLLAQVAHLGERPRGDEERGLLEELVRLRCLLDARPPA